MHPSGACFLCDEKPPKVVSPSDTIIETGGRASIELSKRKLSHFIRNAWHVLEPNTPLEWSWHIQCQADHIQWMLEQWMGRREHTVTDLVINVPPGSLKPCYSKGMVIEKTRGLVALETIAVGDLILTHKGRFRLVEAVAQQGVLPLVTLTTKRGRVIKVAEDHPMLTARGWVQAGEVTLEDTLFEVKGPDCGSQTVSNETARMLGYLIGDGCTSGPCAASFTNQDPETVSDFIGCADTLGFETSVKKRAPSYPNPQNKLGLPSQVIRLKDGGRRKGRPKSQPGPVRAFVRRFGLEGATSYTKHVPREIFEGNDDLVLDFLGAYWACDGGIHDRRDLQRSDRSLGQKSSTVRVDATTVSEELARGLQALLLRVGLSFTLRRKESKLKTKRQGDTYVSWYVVARDQDTSAKFLELVGPRIRHEKRTRVTGMARTNIDQVLNADPVVDISRGEEGECRCLQVEEDHSFAYQGVAVHNSLTLSVFAPAWMWIPSNAPDWSLMAMSGSHDVVLRDARKMRRLIQSNWYRESFGIDWEIAADQNALTDFANTAGGVRHSQTSNSAVTGQRYAAVFNDDPNDVKDISEVKLEAARLSWKAAGNRLNDMRRAIRIVIQQRTHDKDLSGDILADAPPTTEHLCIPMEYLPPNAKDSDGNIIKCACGKEACDTTLGKNDPRTAMGEILHPERNTEAVIVAEKKRLGSLGTAGQLNQRPTPVGGEMFKLEHWRYFDELPRCKKGRLLTESQTMSCDLQFKITGTSRTCLLAMAKRGANRYVFDVVVRKMGITDTVEEIKKMYHKWIDEKHGNRMINKIIIEDKANGPAVMEMLRNEIPGIIADNPVGDKMSRANAVLPTVEAGNVFLLRDAPWLEGFKSELAAFPNGEYDDQVDAFTQALLDMMESSGIARTRRLCID